MVCRRYIGHSLDALLIQVSMAVFMPLQNDITLSRYRCNVAFKNGYSSLMSPGLHEFWHPYWTLVIAALMSNS